MIIRRKMECVAQKTVMGENILMGTTNPRKAKNEKGSIIDNVFEKFVSFACLDTYRGKTHLRFLRYPLWLLLLVQSISLYVMTTYDLTDQIKFPYNQLAQTPWELCWDSFIMIWMIPLTFFSIRIGPSIVAIVWICALYVFNWWIVMGDDFDMEGKSGIESRIDKVYDAFDVTKYNEDEDRYSDAIYNFLIYSAGFNIYVLLPMVLICFSLDMYNYRGEDENELMQGRFMWELKYVKELCTSVPQDIDAPRWTSLESAPKDIYGRIFGTPYGVELQWSPPRKRSNMVASYRIIQISQHAGGGQIFCEKVICEDTKESAWYKWRDEREIDGTKDQRSMDNREVPSTPLMHHYRVFNLNPKMQYAWAVQPISRDPSLRRGKRSPMSHMWQLNSKSAFKKNRLATSRIEMSGWLKNFMAPFLVDEDPMCVEHPSYNTKRKRFCCGGRDVIHFDTPFRLKLGILLAIAVIAMEFIITIYTANYLGDSLNDNKAIVDQNDQHKDELYAFLKTSCDNGLSCSIRINSLLDAPEKADTIGSLAIDVYSSADTFVDSLIAANIAGSVSTLWFLSSFYSGVVQKIRLFREGKRYRNLRNIDVQRSFGVASQIQFIGAIFSFYILGNLLNILMWYFSILCFTWDTLFENLTRPLIEWIIFYILASFFNSMMEKYIFNVRTADPNFFFWFKDSNLYFFIDFILLLYYIPYMGMSAVMLFLYGFSILLGLVFRMDLTNYDEGIEDWDSGFAATMAVIAMNERSNNPVAHAFLRILWSTSTKNQDQSRKNTIASVKSTNIDDIFSEEDEKVEVKVAPSLPAHLLEETNSNETNVDSKTSLPENDETNDRHKMKKDMKKIEPSLRARSLDGVTDKGSKNSDDIPKKEEKKNASETTRRSISSIRARTRWNLAYTLLKNPQLVKLRKRYDSASSSNRGARVTSTNVFASKVEEDSYHRKPSIDRSSARKLGANLVSRRTDTNTSTTRAFQTRLSSSFTTVEMRRGWSPQKNPRNSL